MESIIIEIVLGCTGEEMEFMLPAHVQLGSLVQDIARLIEQMNLSIAFDRDNLVLYDIEQQTLMHYDWTLAQNGVRDGSKLMIL